MSFVYISSCGYVYVVVCTVCYCVHVVVLSFVDVVMYVDVVMWMSNEEFDQGCCRPSSLGPHPFDFSGKLGATDDRAFHSAVLKPSLLLTWILYVPNEGAVFFYGLDACSAADAPYMCLDEIPEISCT